MRTRKDRSRRAMRSAAARSELSISFQELQTEKEKARLRDWKRIGRGEATAGQIQKENSIFTPEEVRSFKIIDLEEMLLKSKYV